MKLLKELNFSISLQWQTTLLMQLMALQALKLRPMMVCRYIDNIDSGLRKFGILFIGVTISLFDDPVDINEGEK